MFALNLLKGMINQNALPHGQTVRLTCTCFFTQNFLMMIVITLNNICNDNIKDSSQCENLIFLFREEWSAV